MDNRPGVRFAYWAALADARAKGQEYPSFEDVSSGSSLETSFIRSVLSAEGLHVLAGPPVAHTPQGTMPVYGVPVQMSPGERPVIRTRDGIRPAFDVPYKNEIGQTVISTRNGLVVVQSRGNY